MSLIGVSRRLGPKADVRSLCQGELCVGRYGRFGGQLVSLDGGVLRVDERFQNASRCEFASSFGGDQSTNDYRSFDYCDAFDFGSDFGGGSSAGSLAVVDSGGPSSSRPLHHGRAHEACRTYAVAECVEGLAPRAGEVEEMLSKRRLRRRPPRFGGSQNDVARTRPFAE